MEKTEFLRKLLSNEEKKNIENVEKGETDGVKEMPGPIKTDAGTANKPKPNHAGSIGQLNKSSYLDQRREIEKDVNQLRSQGIQEFLEKALHEISSESKDEAFATGRSAIERDHRFDITEEYMNKWLIDEIESDSSSWFVLKQTDKLFCALYYLAVEPWSWNFKSNRFLCVPGNLSLSKKTCEMSYFKSILASREFSHLEPDVYIIKASDKEAPDKYFNLITNTWWENHIETYPGMCDDAATYADRMQRECQG